MKTFLWVLALFAIAVGVVVAARYNAGYVLVAFSGYKIELSLNLAATLLVLGFGVVYVLSRAIAGMLALPSEVREFHESRRIEVGRADFMKGLQAFFEGRYGRAEKAAAAALDHGYAPALSAVVAARAASAGVEVPVDHRRTAQDRQNAAAGNQRVSARIEEPAGTVVGAGGLLHSVEPEIGHGLIRLQDQLGGPPRCRGPDTSDVQCCRVVDRTAQPGGNFQ